MVTSVTQVDIEQMRDQVFFEGPERRRRLSRYWLLLLLSAVIAVAGVVSDSTATVIGAMIIAPLMTPILGTVLAVVLTDRANLRRCLLLLAAGAAAAGPARYRGLRNADPARAGRRRRPGPGGRSENSVGPALPIVPGGTKVPAHP